MSETNKHTPGPWAQYANTTTVNYRSDYDVRTCDNNILIARGCSEGNSRLIAAAPEMLDALREILAIVHDSDGVDGFHLNGDIAKWAEFRPTIAAAEEAVAKAEGRSHQ